MGRLLYFCARAQTHVARRRDVAIPTRSTSILAMSENLKRHIRDVRSGRVQAPQADAAQTAAGRKILLAARA